MTAAPPPNFARRLLGPLLLSAAGLLAGCAHGPETPAVRPQAEAAPRVADCPAGLPADARCLRGTDSAGAPYLIALPAGWQAERGVLVVHAHGGPALGAPKTERADEDAKRWSIWVRAGHAYAASVYAQGGVAVRLAAADTERVRQIFVAHVGQPRRTVLHGQSWGAHVAAMAAQTFAAPGQASPSPYHAVLLTSGVLGGGTRSYDVRLDLRVVYQHLCRNHPRPDEPAYPLWQGLPPGSALTRAELARRVEDCLGLKAPAAQRTPEQAQRLRTVLAVTRIPERSLLEHLNWATWHFQDIAFERARGNAFDNTRVRYTGSDDDAALNASVARYVADPAAAARFAADTALNGRIGVPVLTVHAIHDPTAFVELESEFRATMQRGGSAARLVQSFTQDTGHSYLADPVYPALLDALLRWADGGPAPTPAGLAAACTAQEARFGPSCRFSPDYQPPPLDSRSPAR